MADNHEKSSGYNSGTESDNGSQNYAIYERPTGLKGLYSHPITQVVMLGLVCFMGPGACRLLNHMCFASRHIHINMTSSAPQAYITHSLASVEVDKWTLQQVPMPMPLFMQPSRLARSFLGTYLMPATVAQDMDSLLH